jgi:hypothetical protein
MGKITVERAKQYFKVVNHTCMIRLNKFTLIREETIILRIFQSIHSHWLLLPICLNTWAARKNSLVWNIYSQTKIIYFTLLFFKYVNNSLVLCSRCHRKDCSCFKCSKCLFILWGFNNKTSNHASRPEVILVVNITLYTIIYSF